MLLKGTMQGGMAVFEKLLDKGGKSPVALCIAGDLDAALGVLVRRVQEAPVVDAGEAAGGLDGDVAAVGHGGENGRVADAAAPELLGDKGKAVLDPVLPGRVRVLLDQLVAPVVRVELHHQVKVVKHLDDDVIGDCG